MRIDPNDEQTPLTELKEQLHQDSAADNTAALVMILCDRIDKLENGIVYELNEEPKP